MTPTLTALGPAELADARTLVFEYLATTQGERGRPVPVDPDGLPPVLHDEWRALAQTYGEPGFLLLAYDGPDPVGCAGLVPMPSPGTAEVRRLYVRPAHRRGGVARQLMAAVIERAATAGFRELVLDVMPSRRPVIDFYRRLGFVDGEPYPTGAPDPMVFLRRPLSPV